MDITLFLSIQKPSEIVWLLGEIGCDVSASTATASLQEHGFCKATFDSVRVDVFIPTVPFYEEAKLRRRRVTLGQQQAMVWDAETLAVFKMMFFRPQDSVDVQKMLSVQTTAFDRTWVREQLVEMFGSRDVRIARWDELCAEVKL